LDSAAETAAADHAAGFELTATSRDFSRYFPAYLANGFITTTSSLRGTEAAPVYQAGVMDHAAGDVSRPAAMPAWSEIDYRNGTAWLNAGPVREAEFTGYRQTLDMRGGTLATAYTWRTGAKPTRVEVITFASQTDPHLAATRLTLTPEFNGPVTLRFPLEAWPAPAQRLALAGLSWNELKEELLRGRATRPLPAGARIPPPPPEVLTWFDLQEALAAEGRELDLPDAIVPTRAAIWYPGELTDIVPSSDATLHTLGLEARAVNGAAISVAVAVGLPANLPDAVTRLERTPRGTVLVVETRFAAGNTYEFTKFASFSREGWGGGLPADLARVQAARTGGFAALHRPHLAAWHALWRADIVIEGDAALQRTIRSDLFSLLQNTHPDSPWPLGACGMNPNYFGHVFWDCDNWVFPVLLLLHPARARALVTFRSRTLDWARGNAARHGCAGAMFPWESDPEDGTEQTPHFAGVNAEREILLNGNIAIAQWQYFLATGDRDWLRDHGYPVIAATADFWVSRVTRRPAADGYDILHVTSVDEKYTDVDNEAFTNAVAQRNLEIAGAAARVLGVAPAARWSEVAAGLRPPFSAAERRHLMFDPAVPHDRKTWMAGAITFLCYPNLDYPMTAEVRRNNYAYALRQNAAFSPEPNQMMLVMLACHAAQLGEGEDARRWLLHQGDGFLKPPFNQRSETPHNNCTHHLATASGFLQAFVFGLSGLRITEEGLAGRYDPALPAAWPALHLRGICFRGEKSDITLRRSPDGAVRLERRPATHS
jgi:hypothetical protein